MMESRERQLWFYVEELCGGADAMSLDRGDER